MLCNDEQQEAKKLERTSAERLREECSERFSRINDHFSKAIERLDKHFSSFAARVKSIWTKKTAGQDDNLDDNRMYIKNLTFKEIVRWLKDRREGCDVAVLKLDDEKVKELFGSDGEADLSLGDDKYIAVVVMEKNKLKDSLIVQYETLDDELEGALSSGSYVL